MKTNEPVRVLIDSESAQLFLYEPVSKVFWTVFNLNGRPSLTIKGTMYPSAFDDNDWFEDLGEL